MIGGVTHRILPHLSGVLHLHVNRPLNSVVNYCISRAHDHNIAGQEAQQIVNIAEVEDPQGGGKVFGVFFVPRALPQFPKACLHGGGGPQVGEVARLGGVTRLSI